MRTIAAWIMARRMNALVATSGFAVLGFVFPPLLLMSLAAVGLVTMRQGGKEGLLTVAGCVLLFGSMSLIAMQGIRLDLVMLAGLWLMAWLIAMVYRATLTPAWMINATGAAGLLGIAGFYLLVPDPSAFWLVLLDQHIKPLLVQQQLVQNSEDIDRLLAMLAQVLTGGMAAMLSMAIIVSMLLGRWWQALLYNPGGFRREFYELRLGQVTALLMVALLATSLIGQFALTTDMVTVLWMLFFFQGIAVVHNLFAAAGMGTGWLISMYLLVAIVPNYASPVISGLGLVDTWLDFRRRAPRKNKPDIVE